MTTEELDALPAYTLIYLPTDWDVAAWHLVGRVADRNFYTLLHPPDQDGVINNRRPIYMDAFQMRFAVLDEGEAWRYVVEGLRERMDWITKRKLNGPKSADTTNNK